MAARVLLADDTADIRALLRIVLSRHDEFEVVAEAADGSEAVAMAGSVAPDLVLLDLAMPVMDGLEAIPGVRAAAPDCKIVVLSGFNADQMAKEALGVGADAYVEKGTPPANLVHELRRVLGLRLDAADPIPDPVDRPSVPEAPAVPAGRPSPWDAEELSLVTHELFSPLSVIEGFAMLLERRPDAFDPEQVSEQAATILRSAQHLRNLLRTVTDAQRLEVGDLLVSPAPVDLVAVVQGAVEESAAVIVGHPVRVDGPEGVDAVVDAGRVTQVLAHLLSNAAKFSPPGSPIDVEIEATPDHIVVAVRDRGPGVPEERRVELFGRSARLGTSTKGLGLGLYVARGVARAHGGDVMLDPLPDGEPGSRFVLRLPRRPGS